MRREIVALFTRRLGSDLCGNSKGERKLCYVCSVPPNGAPFGNRLRRQDREIVALAKYFALFIFTKQIYNRYKEKIIQQVRMLLTEKPTIRFNAIILGNLFLKKDIVELSKHIPDDLLEKLFEYMFQRC
jgi:hypothetical protein